MPVCTSEIPKIFVLTFSQGFQCRSSEEHFGFCALNKLLIFQNFNHSYGINVSLQKVMQRDFCYNVEKNESGL